MIFRRFALAIGLLCAALASQLPEFAQQYRQRLGGAIDELSTIIAQFDSEAGSLAINRDQGIARLKSNTDPLAQQRGASMADLVVRKDRLEHQKLAFAVAGPVSQFAVLGEDFDAGLARQALADYSPALPVTTAGLVSAAIGLLIGWLLVHLVALPMRRRQQAGAAHATNWR